MRIDIACIYLIIFFISVFSCRNRSSLIGIGDDVPDFDSGPHIFNEKKNDTMLVAKNDVDWWFGGIRTDYSIEDGDSKPDDCKYHFLGGDNNKLNKTGYEGCWFTVEKVSSSRLKITTKENQTGKNRKFSFALQNGNAFKDIIIEQKAE